MAEYASALYLSNFARPADLSHFHLETRVPAVGQRVTRDVAVLDDDALVAPDVDELVVVAARGYR